MNRYPLWKNVMVLGIVLTATILALPNIFGDDMAVQVSRSDGKPVEAATITQIETVLKDKNIPYKSAAMQGKAALVRLPNVSEQLRANDALAAGGCRTTSSH